MKNPYTMKDPWRDVERDGMFAKVPVVLDITHPRVRNAFKCKGCGRKYPAHSIRYRFERYNFCTQCVTNVTPEKELEFETTLEIFCRTRVDQIFYEEIHEKYKGEPIFHIYLNKYSWGEDKLPIGVAFRFTDLSYFRLDVSAEVLKKKWSLGVTRVVNQITEENERDIAPFIKDGIRNIVLDDLNGPLKLFYLTRWDLRPFNVSIKNMEDLNNETDSRGQSDE